MVLGVLHLFWLRYIAVRLATAGAPCAGTIGSLRWVAPKRTRLLYVVHAAVVWCKWGPNGVRGVLEANVGGGADEVEHGGGDAWRSECIVVECLSSAID